MMPMESWVNIKLKLTIRKMSTMAIHRCRNRKIPSTHLRNVLLPNMRQIKDSMVAAKAEMHRIMNIDHAS